MLWETGLTHYWIRKTIPTTEQCTVANDKRNQSVGNLTKIKLKDLTGAFFILGAGIGSAILSFLAELTINRIRKQRKKRRIDQLKNRQKIIYSIVNVSSKALA